MKRIESIKFCIAFMLLVGILTFYGINLVSATSESLGTFKQNDCISLQQVCSNCTSNNITTVAYPNSSISSVNLEMTRNGTNYNCTYCLTDGVGNYVVNGVGDLNGQLKVWAYNFEITTTGGKVSLSNIIIVIVFLCLSGIMFLLGFNFEKDKWILKTAFYLFSLFGILLAVNSARIIASESLGLSAMSNVGLTLIISIILFMFVYMFIYWTIQTFKSVKEKQGVRWNY